VKSVNNLGPPPGRNPPSGNGQAGLFLRIPIGLYRVGADGVFQDANPQLAELLGQTSARDLVDHNIREFLVQPQEFERCLYRLEREEKVFDCEIQLRRQDGTIVHARNTAIPIQDDYGRMVAIEGALEDFTAHKLYEKALLESEARYRTLVDNIDLGITLIDKDYNIIMANAAIGRMLGKPEGQLSGLHCYQEYEKRKYVCDHCPGKRAMETGQPMDVETQGVRDDGTRFWVRNRAFPYYGQDGQIAGFIEVVQDISARKAVEEQLERSEKLHRDLVETLDGIVWVADARTLDFTFVSQQAERLLGYAAEAWLEHGFWAGHLHPDDATEAMAHCRLACETLQSHVLEYRMIAADGRAVWLRDRVRVAADESGKARTLRGLMVDIGSEKRAEQELREQLHLIGQLIEAIPCPVFFKDERGIYQGCNQAFEAYIGKSKAELIGRSVYDIAPPDLADVYQAADQSLFDQHPGAQIYEAAVAYADGSRHNVMFHKATLSRPGGELGGIVGVILDITERKLAEDELRLAATVFENSNEAIMITDAQGKLLRVNHAFTEVTGYGEAEVLGRTPGLLKSGRQGPQWYEAMWQALKETGRWQGEIWNRRKNGEIYPEWLSISCIRDNRGEVTHYIGIFSDMSERKETEQMIEHLAHFDALTGLPNRNLMREQLIQAIAAATRHQRTVALMTINLDRFKNINDTLGHQIGDLLLVDTGHRLKQSVREDDSVARTGGDEFGIVLADLSHPQDAALVAEKILRELEQPTDIAGHELVITCSIGISLHPHDGIDAEDLLKNADTAVHFAKREGGGFYQFFTPQMNTAAHERLIMENSLRRALDRQEFVLHYQPQVDLESGIIVGTEALVRWLHPDMGLVPPAKFIPLAEDSGQIVALGEWVLRTACSQGRRWIDQGHEHLRVAVNLSARQFRQKNLVKLVESALVESGLPPTALELELTESLLMDDPDQAVGTLHELREMGVQFSVDDFGTGYSSLSRLKRFPIHKLKIDKSFVRDIASDANDAAIAQAVIALGHSLQLKVVAEGVETPEQLKFLRHHGCHSIQGYYFSPPVAEEVFGAMLSNGQRLQIPGYLQ
jgi:diguanylate cyclase (GGDEF)-like protein/PAS domain S-box-containing protein